MAAPVLPDLALGALRRMDEMGLTHRGFRAIPVIVRSPGGRETTTYTYATESVPARLNPLALDSPLRADQPSAARKWQLSLKSGTVTSPGDRWRVEGETNGAAWTRTVSVDEVLFPRSHELRRRALCTDVAANP